VFQLIGLDLEQHKQGSPLRGFRLRMPWLLANITGGLICAALGALFAETVQKVVILALFIPLILTLAESISVQSMTLAIEQAASGKRLGTRIRLEIATSLMLGLCAGTIVGVVSLFWRGPFAATLTIAGAVALAMIAASLLGRAIPQFMHALKLNPRIASGPITLAIVDVVTVTLYLGGATLILGR
jgi:magnesium transporter